MNNDTNHDNNDLTIRDEQGKAWQQPPGEPPPSQPPKSNTNLIWVIVGVCFACVLISVGVMAAVMFPVFSQAKHAAKKTATLTNAKQHALGLLMYAADYDDRMPSKHWCDLSMPYTKNEMLYSSLILSEGGSVRYDFAFGGTLQGETLMAVDDVANTFMTFESKNNSKNQVGGIELVPLPGRYRTPEGTASCASFTDGSARFVTDQEFNAAANESGRFQFFVPPAPIGE